jgi:hypothetical protein
MELSLNKTPNISTKIDQKLLETEKEELIKEIRRVSSELQNTYNNFQFIDDELLIDYYTYKIKACETQYHYLLKIAKSMGIENF